MKDAFCQQSVDRIAHTRTHYGHLSPELVVGAADEIGPEKNHQTGNAENHTKDLLDVHFLIVGGEMRQDNRHQRHEAHENRRKTGGEILQPPTDQAERKRHAKNADRTMMK